MCFQCSAGVRTIGLYKTFRRTVSLGTHKFKQTMQVILSIPMCSLNNTRVCAVVVARGCRFCDCRACFVNSCIWVICYLQPSCDERDVLHAIILLSFFDPSTLLLLRQRLQSISYILLHVNVSFLTELLWLVNGWKANIFTYETMTYTNTYYSCTLLEKFVFEKNIFGFAEHCSVRNVCFDFLLLCVSHV